MHDNLRNRVDLLLKGVILCLSVIFVCIVLEASLRIYRKISYVSEHHNLFRFEKDLGWEFIPGAAAKGALSTYPGYNGVVRINSAGMRDKEYSLSKPEGKKRIVVLGDSFVSNVDVRPDKVFTEIMEERLLPKNWEVLNFGVNGYGPVQELLLLEKKAINYAPDIVILVLFIRNDFDDICGTYEWVEGYRRPKAVSFEDKGAIPSFYRPPYPRPPPSVLMSIFYCLNSSDLYQVVMRRIRMLCFPARPQELKLFSKKMNYNKDSSCLLMADTIERIRRASFQHRAQFILVVMPTIYQVIDENAWKGLIKSWRLDESSYDRMLPNRFLSQFALKSNIKLLDLTAAFKSVVNPEKRYFHSKNHHLNEEGNRLVAETIANYLKENGARPG